MELEEVDKIAQGRVWAGSAALELGLVDKLGNLDEAIERAAELAKVDSYKTFFPSEELDWKQRIFKELFSYAMAAIPNFIESKHPLRKQLNLVYELDKFNDPRGIYAVCLNCYPL